jgi:membrane protein DedA with SNARE-associated domain
MPPAATTEPPREGTAPPHAGPGLPGGLPEKKPWRPGWKLLLLAVVVGAVALVVHLSRDLTFETVVADYGLLAVLIGTFFEGETIAVIGGFAAKSGALRLDLVMLCAFLGSLCGDQVAFLLGRRYGRDWVAKHPAWQPKVARALELIEKYRTPLILTFRFFYGLRNVLSFAFGFTDIPLLRFMLLNAIGAAVWAVAAVGGGYLFGAVIELVMDDVKKYQYVLYAVLVLGGTIAFFMRRRKQKALAQKALQKQP